MIFGIGMRVTMIIGLLFLIICGPSKLSEIARDLGRFVNEARRHADDFKSELTSTEKEEQYNRRHES